MPTSAPLATDVEFVTVNTDPIALAQSDETPSVHGPALARCRIGTWSPAR